MTDTKEIRKQLKEQLGYNAKQVSIKRRHYSTIIFTIRDAAVDEAKLKDFGLNFESIDRDRATGEILCGGNTFVRVEYSAVVEAELTASKIEAVKAAIAKIEDSCIIDIEGTDFAISNDYQGFGLWKCEGDSGSCLCHYNSAERAAFAVARGV